LKKGAHGPQAAAPEFWHLELQFIIALPGHMLNFLQLFSDKSTTKKVLVRGSIQRDILESPVGILQSWISMGGW